MKTNVEYNNGKYRMRIAMEKDVDNYITAFYRLDEEIIYFTGSNSTYEESKVRDFFKHCLFDTSRYDFLIFDEDKVIGEVVINEIDSSIQGAHYRICIFCPEYLGRGIGRFATESIIDFAFNHLNLKRVALEVFSFNKRAIKMYESVGFVHEGRLRNAVKDKSGYGDILCMAMIEDDYHH